MLVNFEEYVSLRTYFRSSLSFSRSFSFSCSFILFSSFRLSLPRKWEWDLNSVIQTIRYYENSSDNLSLRSNCQLIPTCLVKLSRRLSRRLAAHSICSEENLDQGSQSQTQIPLSSVDLGLGLTLFDMHTACSQTLLSCWSHHVGTRKLGRNKASCTCNGVLRGVMA